MQQTIQDLNQKIINLQLEKAENDDKLEEKDRKIEELEKKLQVKNIE